jgi:hypothetical protein
MRVGRDDQLPISLDSWTLTLEQGPSNPHRFSSVYLHCRRVSLCSTDVRGVGAPAGDKGTGENHTTTSFEFADVTLTPNQTVTLWYSQKVLEENAADDDDSYHCEWEGLKVGHNNEYVLTLYDDKDVVASSISWPPSHTVSHHTHPATVILRPRPVGPPALLLT